MPSPATRQASTTDARLSRVSRPEKQALSGAFFWLSAFYFVYCARPEDYIFFLRYLPLAKITGTAAFLSLLTSAGKTPRRFKDLPREGKYLFAIIILLFVSGFLSPVWRGGAVSHTIDFAKVYVAWVLTFLLITSKERLWRIIHIQAASVPVLCLAALMMGHSIPRLNGVMGGIYSNANDLAFAIVLSVPFSLAFLIRSKGLIGKLAWGSGLIVMAATLFMTASRSGFIDMVITGTICLWHFGVRGRRFYLVIATLFVSAILMMSLGGRLRARMSTLTGSADGTQVEERAYESFEERKEGMIKAFYGMLNYPVFGIGHRNFPVYSGNWIDVHCAYLQIGVEGGIPVLILYLLFFRRGFKNLRAIRKKRNLDPETTLLAGALHASLIGFVVGAAFGPEAYQYFAYFAVAYTSVLFAISREAE
ncbi:MAG: O-antigen ligase family protein, partial [Acidobacteria bacterium]|nr:O-antigen ligase family protein [Acidobacteriota bacterium]